MEARELLVFDQRPGRLREEDLAAVAGVAYPRTADDAEAVIALVTDSGLARVDSDSDAHGGTRGPLLACDGALCCRGGRDGVLRASEGEEQRVALPVDQLAAGLFERGPEQTVMCRQHRFVALSELADEPRRPLDVGEQERDRAARCVPRLRARLCARRAGRRRQGGVLPEDCLLQLLQGRARFEPEFLDQEGARLLVQ